jgi:hypothetical protein
MADIAFLLLIFFLVTTTIETDAGLDRMLPPMEPPDTDVVIKQKNIFTVNINKNGQLLVEDDSSQLSLFLPSPSPQFPKLELGDFTCEQSASHREHRFCSREQPAFICEQPTFDCEHAVFLVIQG